MKMLKRRKKCNTRSVHLHKSKPCKPKQRHHRHPRSRKKSYCGKIYDKRNISILTVDEHRAYHLLFSNLLPKEVAQILNEKFISPDWKMIAVPRCKNQPD